MSNAPLPDWVIPPYAGFAAEDLDRIPCLPSHTELIDGSLVFVCPQALFHMRMISLLESVLRAAVPAHFTVRREMTVTLGPRQRPEADLMIIKAAIDRSPGQATFGPEDLVLVVEVISPESRERDVKRKPLLYATAGIPHFWLIENVGGRPAVHTYELDPVNGVYSLTGIHHDKLTLTVPFPIDIDLTKIEDL